MNAPDCKAAPLAIRLFGPLEVRLHGVPLPRLRSRKGQWLLASLLLRHDADVERAWLAGTLWPDSSMSQALALLRRELTDLRRALGPEAHRLRSTTIHTLRLDLSGAEADLVAFDAAITAGGASSLEQAVALYRGPLLEGCGEEWVFQERRAREQAYLGALETLAAVAQARDDARAAEGYLRLAVAADPLRESAQRALMRTLAAGGNYAAALHAHRDLRLLLHRELNTEPDPDTCALFEQIRTEARRRALASASQPSGSEAPRSAPAAGLRPTRKMASPTNLPHPLTSFIGREQEVAAVKQLLATSRLVTLTGAGGCGKTRLALQVAAELREEFAHGVVFVNLASLRDPGLVASAIAQAVGVRESGGRPLVESLKEHLQEKQLLLLLDNFEQLLEAAPLVADLLEAGARLRALVTSRAPLRVRGEQEFVVPPLALPDPKRLPPMYALSRYAAVALFAQRAAAVRADFSLTEENAPTVAEICCRLDGLPLAIELAAARVKLLSPQALLPRLEKRLALLTGGARDLPARQQTLRDAIAWSHDLLSEAEQWLFRRLAVFVGGFTLEAAQTVCNGDSECAGASPREIDVLDGIASLVDKNLVHHQEQPNGEPRFGMLETVREYGRECLESSGEEKVIRRQHARFCLEFAERAEPQLFGPEQGRWLDRLDAECDNLRSVLAWSRAEPGEAATGLRLAAKLHWFWGKRGYLSEGREQLAGLLALVGTGATPAVRADTLRRAGWLALKQGDLDAARALCGESLALWRDLGGQEGIAISLNTLGIVAQREGEYEAARRLLEEALTINRECDRRQSEGANLHNLGDVAMARGDYVRARTLYEAADAIDRELGIPGGWAFRGRGQVALKQGDAALARWIFQEDLRIVRELGDRQGIANALNNLGNLAYHQGQNGTARAFYEESLTILRELADQPGIAASLGAFAALAAAQGQPEGAARLFGTSEALREAVRVPLPLAERTDYERAIAATRAALGEEAFAAAWAEGRAMSLEQAVCLALEKSAIPTKGRQDS